MINESISRFDTSADIEISSETLTSLSLNHFEDLQSAFGYGTANLEEATQKSLENLKIILFGSDPHIIEAPSFTNIDNQRAGTFLLIATQKHISNTVAFQLWIVLVNNQAYVFTFTSLTNVFDEPEKVKIRDHFIKSIKFLRLLPQPILDTCLKEHDKDTINIYPVVQIFVDGKQKLLPDTVGKEIKDGKECLHLIHTDEIGEHLHIQYIRPIRLSMDDFMNIYSIDNKTISVIDNSTKSLIEETVNLDQYDVLYSYFSENKEYTKISNSILMPPFTKEMVIKMELKSK